MDSDAQIRQKCNDIVTKLYNDRAVPRIIYSGRFRCFRLPRQKELVQDMESAVMLKLLESPSDTVAAWETNNIIKYIVQLCCRYNVNIRRRAAKEIHCPDFVFEIACE